MSNTRLKKYLEIKSNPTLVIFKQMEERDYLITQTVKKITEAVLDNVVKEFQQNLDELLQQIDDSIPNISKQVAEELKNHTLSYPKLFKGDSIKGDKGDSIKGDKGDNYILTEKDRKEIARKIEVPVVEKIIEKPTITTIEKVIDVKPEEIAKKLNTLSETIKIDVINGLDKELANLKQNIRSVKGSRSGGGMGNILVETPTGTIDGSNTIFTLSTTPKTNSLILLVNGQFQRKDIEYTISGKTITMLWIIPLNSDIFAWFIR